MTSEPETAAVQTVVISLAILNMYELYDDVVTTVADHEVPAPPVQAALSTDVYEDALADWAWEHLFDLTGVGHEDGDSWYEVTVLACSDSQLVGKQFDFGF